MEYMNIFIVVALSFPTERWFYVHASVACIVKKQFTLIFTKRNTLFSVQSNRNILLNATFIFKIWTTVNAYIVFFWYVNDTIKKVLVQMKEFIFKTKQSRFDVL